MAKGVLVYGLSLCLTSRVARAISLKDASTADDHQGAPDSLNGLPPQTIFRQFDNNYDGVLNPYELTGMLQGLGFSEAEVVQMRREMDPNVDGVVDWPEFYNYISPSGLFAQGASGGGPLPSATHYDQRSAVGTASPPGASGTTLQPLGTTLPSLTPVGGGSSTVHTSAFPTAPPPAPAPQGSPFAPASPPAPAPELVGSPSLIAPFGKEATALELQKHASRAQDTLVDAIENAEVSEIKRAVFRALTRLRAAQIKEFDTIARLETQAIDEYNDNHHYRGENSLNHLAENEQPVVQDKYTSFH